MSNWNLLDAMTPRAILLYTRLELRSLWRGYQAAVTTTLRTATTTTTTDAR